MAGWPRVIYGSDGARSCSPVPDWGPISATLDRSVTLPQAKRSEVKRRLKIYLDRAEVVVETCYDGTTCSGRNVNHAMARVGGGRHMTAWTQG